MDRIVYILSSADRRLTCTVRVTKLMKWESFSTVDFTNLRVLFRPQYATYVAAEDRPILLGLIQLVKREGQAPVLDGDYGAEIFQAMLATRRLFFDGGNRIRLQAGDPLPAELNWAAGAADHWRPQMTLPAGTPAQVFALNPPCYIDPATNTCGPLLLDQPDGLGAAWLAAREMSPADASTFCLRLAKQFPTARFPTPAGVRLHEVDHVLRRVRLTVQLRSLTDIREHRSAWVDLRDRLRLRVRFQYGEGVVAWDASDATVSYRQDGTIVRVARDAAWEKAQLAALARHGVAQEERADAFELFNFDSSLFTLGANHRWRDLLDPTTSALIAEFGPIDYAKGLDIEGIAETAMYAEAHAADDETFGMDLGVERAGRRFPLLPILHQALRAQPRRAPEAILTWLRDGDFALRVDAAPDGLGPTHYLSLPPATLVRLGDHLHELFDRRPFDAAGHARLNRWRLGELVTAGVLVEKTGDGLAEIVRLCARLGSGVAVTARAAPPGLRATLRPYQTLGLGWLMTLDEVVAGGILADDMGLGKTIQTIAHLLELKRQGRLRRGVLIVAPTSVIDNWEDELARFAPDLTVARFHGADRDTHWTPSLQRDVVITTYALLWRDCERLQTRPWDLVILDEAQNIKNAASRTAQAARQLPAVRRLCLTGTPIENRLEDIWSLFEFLLPGFLGDETTFRNLIAKPLAEDEDSVFANMLRERLRRRLAPFVLRRNKADVLPELPEKTEVVISVTMTPHQADLYETLRQESVDDIRATVRANGLARSKIQILARLLKLRQICCDPRLLAENSDVGAGANATADLHDSAKLEALLDLVARLRGQDDRILIFSQFTSMLDLIAAALTAAGHDHLMLTGQTRNRAEIVQRFQAGECPLFLISLKAGGAGLNLTAANCVIHYDPWWNPAVERQATDRSHRLGQGKPVFVYKLITDDSIEAKIQQLHRSKLALVEGLLSEGDVERLELDATTIDYLLEA